VFGATVALENMNFKQIVTRQIVGDDEADIKISKISVDSPVARVHIGKYTGDIVGVEVPSGVRKCEVTKVVYV
jgi:transcription elongation factor GreA